MSDFSRRSPSTRFSLSTKNMGFLEFQAFPRSEGRYSFDEYAVLRDLTKEISERSGTVYDWCGSTGRLPDRRELVLTLCDDCDRRFPDPPYPLHGSP
jgi:hypothetical protein